MSSRVSARLDDRSQAVLESIQAQTGQSVTQVIADALDSYHRSLLAKARDGNRNLLALAGIFEGPSDLSARYKDELDERLDDKFARHR